MCGWLIEPASRDAGFAGGGWLDKCGGKDRNVICREDVGACMRGGPRGDCGRLELGDE